MDRGEVAVLVAILSVFGCGFISGWRIGFAAGVREMSTAVWAKCIDWAALALKGSPEWRDHRVATILRVGTLLAGAAVEPPNHPDLPIDPHLLKGNHV